jgi:hypothetical protein
MASRTQGFIRDCRSQINQFLGRKDAWAALKAEYDSMTANGIVINQADIDAVFGVDSGVTKQMFLDALVTMQTAVEYIADPVRAPKLYRMLE